MRGKDAYDLMVRWLGKAKKIIIMSPRVKTQYINTHGVDISCPECGVVIKNDAKACAKRVSSVATYTKYYCMKCTKRLHIL